MNPALHGISFCKLCLHYDPEGRRGGMCHKLNVPVAATWASCSLAVAPFTAETRLDSLPKVFQEKVFQESVAIAVTYTESAADDAKSDVAMAEAALEASWAESIAITVHTNQSSPITNQQCG